MRGSPILADFVEERPDIGVEYVVHLRAADAGHQGVQRIMLATLGPETIREPEEILLVDRVQHGDCCPLDDLVLKSRDRERALPPIRLRYVPPPGRQCPVRSPMDPSMQVLNPAIEVCFVVLPCQPIDARGGLSPESEEGCPQGFRAEMVVERREPFLLPLPRGIPYALRRL